ncbi:MAG: DUF4332 domain-containing protein, partial [Armatimonadota bacterium]
MEGGGFAYDDIVLTPAGAAPTLQPLTVATPPGMGPTPTPGMAPAGPPAQPLSAQMQKGGGTVVTALAGGAAGRLQQAGVAQPDALVQRIQSRNQLAALSQSTGVAQDHLLFLAQAAELAQIIGPQNIGRQDLLLLARTDIDRPEDLAAYSGRAQQLAGRLGHEAAALGLPAPSMQRVAYWVQAAAQRASRLPGSQQLLPENMAQRGAPIPFRHVSFGNPTEAEMLAQLQGTLPPPMAGAGMPGFAIAKLIHMPFTIQPGQKSYAQEFDATTPGLYRAEVGIARKGGIVELDWFIEKPKVSLQVAPRGRSVAGRFPRIGEQPLTATPVVSGYAPIISGGNQLGQGQYELYFWVNKKDVPLNGKLRLRLVVRRNQNAKPVVKPPIGDPDRDQVTPSAGGPPDPVIRGTAFVTYQKPVRTQYDVSVHVPIYSTAPNKRTYPIHVVEVPLYTVAPLGVIAVRAPSGPSRTPAYRGQRAFKLTARLDPIPNAFKITYLPIGYQWIPGVQPGDEGTLFYPDLLRDGVPVQGDLYHGKGITMVTHSPKNGVQNGVYSLLFGAKHQMLSTRGAVFDRPQTPPTANFGVNVTLSLGGGKIPTRYVAELFFLEMSDQGEYGNDDEDNDEGTGEFKIVSTSMLAKSLPPPTPGQIWGPGAQPGSGAQAGIHYTCAGDSYDPWEIPARQNKRIACFPRRVLWVWAEEELAKYDRLAITVLVMEDDKASWLKAAKELFSILLNFAKTAYNAFKMQWKDALSSLVSAVKGLSSQVDFEAGVDDLMGTPSMITGKPWGWGFMPGESESWFG